MGLEAVFLKVPPSVTQVTNVEEGTILHRVSFALAPDALVAQLVARPIP